MRFLGVDFGARRTGLAVGDSDDAMVFALRPVQATTRQGLVAELAAVVRREALAEVVFGLPLAADGQESEVCRQVRNVAAELARETGVHVHFVDESFTSWEAGQALRQTGLHGRRLKQALDSQSAALILESFFRAGNTDL